MDPAVQQALQGKCVVITGSGRGLGAAYARFASVGGAAVVVNDIDPEPVADVVSEIRAGGGEAVGVVADVSSWDGAAEAITACVDAFGRIDGLVNNAGRFTMSRLEEMDPDDVAALVASNVMGTAFCASHAARHMVRWGAGSIVNVTSGAHAGIPMMGVYAATKGAVASFTYAWAAELVGTGVRCNAISPLGRTRMVDTRDVWTFDAVADALATDLVHRQSPTGIVGIRPDLTAAASAFWEAS